MKQPLLLRCWEGYDTRPMLAPFEARHATRVQPQTLLSDAAAAERIAAGDSCHVLNINNAWVADYLHPRGLLRRLDEERHASHAAAPFQRLCRWTRAPDDGALIGIAQRFGAFNLVVNTRAIAPGTAREAGFELARDPRFQGRYGVLLYEDFNIFHLCIASGFNPFEPLDAARETRFGDTARHWFSNAGMISDDHHALNRALVEGRIDFYLSGGTYTASPARLAGHHQVLAVTPLRGPIHGRGGIVFTEITCLPRHPRPHPRAADFLAYLLEPSVAARAACLPGTCNPVVQMGDPRVLASFSREQLHAIQWDTLEEDLARCADYQLVPGHAALRERLRAAVAASPLHSR